MENARNRPMHRVLPSTISDAGHADAGDCFKLSAGRLSCLPTVINIGVQKAGTGELQTWLGAHPRVITHGGEVHFFDTMKHEPSCTRARERASLRLRYARFLWRHRPLTTKMVGSHEVVYEKTPAYFDQARPDVVLCAVPSVKIIVMLRMPTARAVSAYHMCQTEMKLRCLYSMASLRNLPSQRTAIAAQLLLVRA